MSSPDVSIMVCTFNRAELLEQALGSLLDLKMPPETTYEVVVVDNASTDATPEVVQRVAQQANVPVRYTREPRGGIAYTRNHGLDAAQGEWLAFFDDDQLAEPDWLFELLQTAKEHDTPCVGGARTLRLPDGAPELGPFCRELLGEYVGGDRPVVFPRTATPTTGNLILHRRVFDRVGRFDEDLHASGEDAHLYLRILKAGFVSWYNPRAVVHHLIPEYRLSPDYFKWTVQRHGWNSAHLDWQLGRRLRVSTLGVARMLKSACVFVPRMMAARLAGKRAAAFDQQCLALRSWAYVRGGLGRLAPKLTRRARFAEYLEFRAERSAFADS